MLFLLQQLDFLLICCWSNYFCPITFEVVATVSNFVYFFYHYFISFLNSLHIHKPEMFCRTNMQTSFAGFLCYSSNNAFLMEIYTHFLWKQCLFLSSFKSIQFSFARPSKILVIILISFVEYIHQRAMIVRH